MKLVIFDLDQTLVDFLPVHEAVTTSLFQRFFNVDARLTEIDFAGKNLKDNFRQLARLKGIPDEVIDRNMPQLLESYDALFAASLPKDARRYVLPGARKLLEELAKTTHIIALYTGDSPGIVDAVFKATGPGKFFRFCFYGTEVVSRAEMVRLAIARGRELTGKTFENKDIVIVGDSVRDVECGKLFGALTIAGYRFPSGKRAARVRSRLPF